MTVCRRITLGILVNHPSIWCHKKSQSEPRETYPGKNSLPRSASESAVNLEDGLLWLSSYDVGKEDSVKCCLEVVRLPVLCFMSNEELIHIHGNTDAGEMMPPSMSVPFNQTDMFFLVKT